MALEREHGDRWWLVALPAMVLGLASCESPFKGESQRPREPSGWEVDDSNASFPTQRELDDEQEGLPDP